MDMKFLPDMPITTSLQDLLGYGEFVDLIKRSIHNTSPPFVYGVLGDWGSGKTSILGLLREQLDRDFREGRQPYLPIWFNAWEYENEANIIYPLLYAIKRDYQERAGTPAAGRAFGRKFLEVVATSTLALTDVGLRVATKQFTGEALKLEDVAKQMQAIKERPDELDQILGGWADQVTELKDAFAVLLDTYASDMALQDNRIERDKLRFVIMIDDLDRCLPDTAIAILESIKNYLSVNDRCIFVLGLNPRVVYEGIKIKYKGLTIDGRNYLEKILNYSFYVPDPEENKLAEYVVHSVDQLMAGSTIKPNRALFIEFGQIVKQCRFGNPRQLKRIFNRYLLFINRFEDRLQRFHNPNLIRLMILAEYFPDVFAQFVKNAERARTEFVNIQNDEFDHQQFENRYGVSLQLALPHLVQMPKLFDLVVNRKGNNASLQEEVNAILSIARTV